MSKKILVVEDNIAMRESLVGMLKSLDFEVTETGSFEETREILDPIYSQFDFVITDYDLGGWTGRDVCDLVSYAVPGAKKILMSGLERKGWEEYADEFVSKGNPFDLLKILGVRE